MDEKTELQSSEQRISWQKGIMLWLMVLLPFWLPFLAISIVDWKGVCIVSGEAVPGLGFLVAATSLAGLFMAFGFKTGLGVAVLLVIPLGTAAVTYGLPLMMICK